ncbi:hypothetical protein QAD02_010113 [Eretmocerus hayati]|uniref:Uncharacterized protein n=1 Tax=Eretmocerus hayati TaxID=131215 RepID=A0ACC2NBD6_9HYME|nr:hypothetical protein QAD02_010113 [Eretmocerus hayati]
MPTDMQDDFESEALLVRNSNLAPPNHYSFVVIVECTSDVFSSTGEYVPMSDYSHGVLVTLKHVLTLSHGIHPYPNREIQVTLSSGESISITEDGIGLTYNRWAQSTRNQLLKQYEDVVILTLPRRLSPQEVQPVALPRRACLFRGLFVMSVARGETDDGVILNNLYRVSLRRLNKYDCKRNYDSSKTGDVTTGKIICTSQPPEMRISDRGAPILYDSTILAGINLVSLDKNTRKPDSPINIHLNIYFIRRYIEMQIGDEYLREE